jgi:hypothetical protein
MRCEVNVAAANLDGFAMVSTSPDLVKSAGAADHRRMDMMTVVSSVDGVLSMQTVLTQTSA